MELVDLGTLDGGDVSQATDVNERGLVVGWSETTVEGSSFTRAVRWSADDELTPLAPLREDGRGDSEATGVNSRGTVVGSARGPDWGWRAVRWPDDGPPEPLGHLSTPPDAGGESSAASASARPVDTADSHEGASASDDSRAADVNARGTVVGHSNTGDGTVHAFRWTARDGMTDLETLRADGTGRSVATAIADNGTIVGQSDADDGQTHAFQWTARDGMTDLGTANTNNASAAFDIHSGTVVGWHSASGTFGTRTATRWRRGTEEALGTFRVGDTGVSQAYGVVGNAVVGVSQVDAGGTHGCAWFDGRMLDLGTLQPEDTGESSAVALNVRGRSVVGWSQTENGSNHAVRWMP